MLKFFRNKVIAKVVFWSLIILILPAFVLWGTGSTRSKDKGPSYVGTINNKKVSFNELSESMAAMRCLFILNYFDKPQVLDAFLNNKPLIAKTAWDRLIVLKEAKIYKIKIPDKDVIAYIRRHPLFLRNGEFDDKLYEYILRYNIGLDMRSFEEIIRRNLEIKKLNEILTKDMTASEEEKIKKVDEWFKSVSVKAGLNINLEDIEKH